jgi:hypothetical protein
MNEIFFILALFMLLLNATTTTTTITEMLRFFDAMVGGAMMFEMFGCNCAVGIMGPNVPSSGVPELALRL